MKRSAKTRRSNRKFEEGSGIDMSYITIAGNWYPGNEWKGDIARMIMYMYVRYPSQCLPNNVGVGSTSYSNFGDMPDVFLDWNAQDPVSQYETNRNNILNTIQGNRNPFIDNPYLATMIWNGPEAADPWNALGVAEADFGKVRLYPTMTRDWVYATNDTGERYFYKVYSTTGQLMADGTLGHAIDVSHYASGLYLIEISNQANSQTYKVIKN